MQHWTLKELRHAEQNDEGFCLSCGTKQPYPSFGPNHRPLCVECNQYTVLSAEDVLSSLALLREEDEEEDDWND